MSVGKQVMNFPVGNIQDPYNNYFDEILGLREGEWHPASGKNQSLADQICHELHPDAKSLFTGGKL